MYAGVAEDEFDRDNNIEGEEQVTVAHDEAFAAEKSAASENVDSVISRSILDEEAEFLRKVNAAFRRFDVYGTSEEEDPFTHRDEETEEAGGLILIEDAPDALVACGLPIEKEEAENLVVDLASGTLSSEFQGFTKAEFVLVCKRSNPYSRRQVRIFPHCAKAKECKRVNARQVSGQWRFVLRESR